METLQSRFETLGAFAIFVLITGMIGASMMAWLDNGSRIWIEMRLAEIAGCFGF